MSRGSDLLIADFEGPDFGEWTVSGTAFGSAPAQGTLPEQSPLNGFRGRGVATSFHGGDKATGTLTSPEFVVSKRYLNFLVGGGEWVGKTCVNVLVGNEVVRSATGRDDETLVTATFDLGEFAGQRARIQILDAHTGSWGHINADHFVLSDEGAVPAYVQNPPPPSDYLEPLRPQFHFTARSNWLNDPNGLLFHNGEYHLFFQYNPIGREWGNMTWGHAVSTNLMNWTELAPALRPDASGTKFSGSAVVDRANTAGFGTPEQPALVAVYTAAGGTSAASQGRPFTQGLAFSKDRGRTWTEYSGNPVLTNQGVGDRDPKVFWHAPTARWVMPLYVGVPDSQRPEGALGEAKLRPELHFYASTNLTTWSPTGVFAGELYECPGLVELPIDADAKNTRWVLWGADGRYWIGRFDGQNFSAESGPHIGDYGANFYAAQAWDDLPKGRKVAIGWMRGGAYPGMPFNQQMGFPLELTLQSTPAGVRLVKWPVNELRDLFVSVQREDLLRPLRAGRYPLTTAAFELMDFELEFQPGPAQTVTLELRGIPLVWRADRAELTVLGKTLPAAAGSGSRGRRTEFRRPWGPDFQPWDDSVRLRVLLDRTSLEVFVNGGLAVGSFCVLPERPPETVLLIEGGDVTRARFTARELHSAWPQ